MTNHSKSDSINLTGQVVVVTGGGRGIGRAMAQVLAGAGASVAILARSENELAETVAIIRQSGGRALAFPADVTVAEAVRIAFDRVTQSLGPVDLLINNAGALGPLGPFWENDPIDWWRVINRT